MGALKGVLCELIVPGQYSSGSLLRESSRLERSLDGLPIHDLQNSSLGKPKIVSLLSCYHVT